MWHSRILFATQSQSLVDGRQSPEIVRQADERPVVSKLVWVLAGGRAYLPGLCGNGHGDEQAGKVLTDLTRAGVLMAVHRAGA